MPEGVFLNNIKYLSFKEAGSYASYTHDYVSRLCREGRIPGRQVGRVWYVEAEPFSAFLDQQKDKKNENNKSLSKECKRTYNDIASEKELEWITQIRLPKITIPKYLVQEITAVSLSVVLVFGTYLAKDSSQVHSVFDASRMHVAQVYENVNNLQRGVSEAVVASSQKAIEFSFDVTDKKSRENIKEFFTYENLYNTSVNTIVTINDVINEGLSSYLSLINNSGDVLLAGVEAKKGVARIIGQPLCVWVFSSPHDASTPTRVSQMVIPAHDGAVDVHHV